MEKGWESIYSSDKPHLAGIVRELLAESGIESIEMNHRDSFLTTIGEIEIFVMEKDSVLARTIILQHNL